MMTSDALQAHTRCMELGAWNVSSQAQAMELHIPAIHGPGGSRFYFVDRWQEFSIYDIDFKPIPTVDQHPAATAGMSYFGVVQYIGAGRSADWLAYFEHMFDFSFVPDDQRCGILPKGKLMKSPCGNFLWQLIEPDPWMDTDESPECLQRIGLGAVDVGAESECRGAGEPGSLGGPSRGRAARLAPQGGYHHRRGGSNLGAAHASLAQPHGLG
jgi:4-hydroxyphenylpyruvate dioxygenase